MTYEYVKDYLWGEDIVGVDGNVLVEACLNAEQFLKQAIHPSLVPPNGAYGNFTTSVFRHYNILTYPTRPIIILFEQMREKISPFLRNDDYVIQCWFNVYRAGEKIDWHDHWPDKAKVFHGFYCLQTEEVPSYTDYKVPGVKDDVRIHSRDGLLIFGKSEGDRHASSLWYGSDPRITIAFDIIPTIALEQKVLTLNHFIPFVSRK